MGAPVGRRQLRSLRRQKWTVLIAARRRSEGDLNAKKERSSRGYSTFSRGGRHWAFVFLKGYNKEDQKLDLGL